MNAPEKALIPSLRFPEFSGEWESQKLNWLAEVIDGDRGVNYPKAADFELEGDCLFLNAKNVTKSGFRFDKKMFISSSHDAVLNKGKASRDDILLTTRGSIGNFAHYNTTVEYDSIRINSGMVIIRLDKLQMLSEFFYIFSQSSMIISYIQKVAFGSAQPQLTVSEILRFPVIFPKLPEQQKIADYLGAVDAKLLLLERRRDALTAYKKGMMQRIFAQEIRFTQEDGTAFPDWQEKRLGELGKFMGGGTPDTNEDSYWIGDIPWISSSDLSEESITKIDVSRKISIEALNSSATKLVPKNSLLIVSRVGVGKFAATSTAICTSQDFCNFTPRSDNVIFIAYWLSCNKNKLFSLCQGTSIKGLTSIDLKLLIINTPHQDEQQKIADFLCVIDDKITAATRRITAIQDFKKSMLQQMFV